MSLRSWAGALVANPADGDFYSRAFDESVALVAVGYDYGGNWASSPGGTSTR